MANGEARLKIESGCIQSYVLPKSVPGPQTSSSSCEHQTHSGMWQSLFLQPISLAETEEMRSRDQQGYRSTVAMSFPTWTHHGWVCSSCIVGRGELSNLPRPTTVQPLLSFPERKLRGRRCRPSGETDARSYLTSE